MFLPAKTTWSGRRVASLYERVGSHIIDILVQGLVQGVLVLIMAWEALVQVANDLLSGEVAAGEILKVLAGDGRMLVYSVLIGWVIGGVYETVFTRIYGGTLGKILLGIEVRDEKTGTRLSWGRCAGRWLGLGWAAPAGVATPAAQFIPVLGYLVAWTDPSRRALHDRLSGGIVVARK